MKVSLKKILDFIGFKNGLYYKYQGLEHYMYYENFKDGKDTLHNVLVAQDYDHKPTDIVWLRNLRISELLNIVELNKVTVQSEVENFKCLNKYNLKYSDIKKLRIIDSERAHQKPFWRNENIKAYCLSGGVGKGLGGSMSTFWLGFYDDGKTDFHFTAMEDMCGYTFEEFFDKKEIEDIYDLEIQINFLKLINKLLDEKVLEIG